MTSPLDALKGAAASLRSQANLLHGPTVKFDGTEGKWKTQDEPDLNSQHFIAIVPDLVHGVVKWVNSKPISHLGRVIGNYNPPARERLDERDEGLWVNGKDPWQVTHCLPLLDPETAEPFLYKTTSHGGRDALATLLMAYVDNCEKHPEDATKLPLIELNADSYINKTHGRRIYIPRLEFLEWVELPKSAKQFAPPELIERVAEPEAETAAEEEEMASSFDDQIPF